MVRYSFDSMYMLLMQPSLDDLSSLNALISALSDLDQMFGSIEEAYLASLEHDKYERWQEKT